MNFKLTKNRTIGSIAIGFLIALINYVRQIYRGRIYMTGIEPINYLSVFLVWPISTVVIYLIWSLSEKKK